MGKLLKSDQYQLFVCAGRGAQVPDAVDGFASSQTSLIPVISNGIESTTDFIASSFAISQHSIFPVRIRSVCIIGFSFFDGF